MLAVLALMGCSPKRSADPGTDPPRGPLRITQFYASPANPPKGERSLICYSTENAETVRLDPPDQPVWPSPSRCFEIVPTKPVTYTLTAERGSEQVTQSVTIAPGPPAAEILNVNIEAREVPRGTTMTVCFKARNAASVTVTPGSRFGEYTPERGCVQQVMEQTTLFRVRARNGAGEIVDGEDVEVKVK
jgi:hypothetical protein